MRTGYTLTQRTAKMENRGGKEHFVHLHAGGEVGD